MQSQLTLPDGGGGVAGGGVAGAGVGGAGVFGAPPQYNLFAWIISLSLRP